MAGDGLGLTQHPYIQHFEIEINWERGYSKRSRRPLESYSHMEPLEGWLSLSACFQNRANEATSSATIQKGHWIINCLVIWDNLMKVAWPCDSRGTVWYVDHASSNVFQATVFLSSALWVFVRVWSSLPVLLNIHPLFLRFPSCADHIDLLFLYPKACHLAVQAWDGARVASSFWLLRCGICWDNFSVLGLVSTPSVSVVGWKQTLMYLCAPV